jgi:hypothetical protein
MPVILLAFLRCAADIELRNDFPSFTLSASTHLVSFIASRLEQ